MDSEKVVRRVARRYGADTEVTMLADSAVLTALAVGMLVTAAAIRR